MTIQKPDLAKLEQVCPEAYTLLLKFTKFKELSQCTIDENSNLCDGEITVIEKTINAIATRLLALSAEIERLETRAEEAIEKTGTQAYEQGHSDGYEQGCNDANKETP